jgi:hypothetical protein
MLLRMREKPVPCCFGDKRADGLRIGGFKLGRRPSAAFFSLVTTDLCHSIFCPS